MTQTIHVTSTVGGTGKTAVALALGRIAAERGHRVGYMKPKGTRLRSRRGSVRDEDPLVAAELLKLENSLDMMEPIIYSSSFITQVLRGREEPTELRRHVRERFTSLSTDREVMIVEGASRLDTGAMINLTDPGCADLLGGTSLLITDFLRIEDIDIILGSIDLFEVTEPVLLFNDISHEARDILEADVIPFLHERDIDVLGILPHSQQLVAVTIGELAESIGATVLTDCSTDALVERFSVGSMSGDAAYAQFRRTTDSVVITGGDRPSVQSAAIEAPGVKALLLTGGHRPSESILGAAESNGMPILSVSAESLTAIDRVEGVIREGRPPTEETVALMQELLERHVDLDRLLENA